MRDVFADRCQGCGAAVSTSDQDAVRVAFDDLPPLQPVVTRVVLHACTPAAASANASRAVAPTDMPEGSPFGPNIQALVVYPRHRHNDSYCRLVEMLDEVAGLEISEGRHRQHARSRRTRVRGPGGGDREGGPRLALNHERRDLGAHRRAHLVAMVFDCASAVLHRIVPTRGKAVPPEFLAGTVPEVWISDRLASLTGHARLHQFCLAHLSATHSLPSTPATTYSLRA